MCHNTNYYHLNKIDMKKLLNYLTFGHHIVVDELTGWGNESNISGFTIGDCCEAYQGLPIVIATAGDNVQIIAPVCKTSDQLLQFLTEVKDFCKERKDVPWWFYEKTEKLANWLYYNNPNGDLWE